MSTLKRILSKEETIAQNLVYKVGDAIYSAIDEKGNFIINYYGNPCTYIARINKNWYKINMLKNYWGLNADEKATVKTNIANKWANVPANENYIGIIESENDQAVNQIQSIELCNEDEKEIIEKIRANKIEFNEDFDNLIEFDKLIRKDEQKPEVFTIDGTDSKVLTYDTVFGKAYQYKENERIIVEALVFDNTLYVDQYLNGYGDEGHWNKDNINFDLGVELIRQYSATK
ncbi:hypothetical protein [Flavobacterium daemonense]|uniref:hypothetical protein n=1 Tax=Flavobacterium daemonense TaxID=1393049 RepID=UPI001185745D|nr:hypothetical protein [Flavobacterium daemonense]KAF2337214.1 hypothetical protein FND99_02030 [Flavobacterium daemonense]